MGRGFLLDYKELKYRWRNKKLYEGDGVMILSEGMMACVSWKIGGKKRGRSLFFGCIFLCLRASRVRVFRRMNKSEV